MSNVVAVSQFPTVIMRKDHGYRPYRLRCRFTTDAYPSPREWVESRNAAAYAFIADMAKQGWEYLDEHGISCDPTNPQPHYEAFSTPRRPKQEPWQLRARQVQNPAAVARLDNLATPGLVSLPSVAKSDRWDFELTAVFLRKTIVFEDGN